MDQKNVVEISQNIDEVTTKIVTKLQELYMKCFKKKQFSVLHRLNFAPNYSDLS
jgi:Zn-dependent M16 (insulinase) family peptidase